MFDDGFVNIRAGAALWREIPRAIDGEIDHAGAFGLVERRHQVDASCCGPSGELVGIEIECIGGKRAIAAGIVRLGADAVGVVIGDRFHPLLVGRGHTRIADDDRAVAKMIEQRRHLVLKQRKPMLHARQPPPVRNRLIQRVTRRRGAEAFTIAAAEALDAFFVEQRFGCGQQREAVDPSGRALVTGIEGPDAFDLVAEEIEPQAMLLAAGEQVHQPAAHREFTRIRHGFDADIAIGLQKLGEPIAADALARRQPRDELADTKRRQRALARRIRRRHHQLRRFRWLLQFVQRRQSFGHHPKRGGGAIVGQAIPRRIAEHLNLGREIGRRRRDGAHLRLVRGDEDGALVRPSRQIGEQPRQEPGRHARQRQRLLGGKDFGKIGHAVS